jgi:MYXO-CTERM domain-containing protein
VDELAEGFSVGRSLDGGATVEPLLVLRTIGELPSCPTCSATAVTCPSWQDDLSYDFATYFGAGTGWTPIDASIPSECLDAGTVEGGARDAGARDAGSRHDAGAAMDGGAAEIAPGCGCRAGSGASSGLLSLALALGALLRRRRGPP